MSSFIPPASSSMPRNPAGLVNSESIPSQNFQTSPNLAVFSGTTVSFDCSRQNAYPLVYSLPTPGTQSFHLQFPPPESVHSVSAAYSVAHDFVLSTAGRQVACSTSRFQVPQVQFQDKAYDVRQASQPSGEFLNTAASGECNYATHPKASLHTGYFSHSQLGKEAVRLKSVVPIGTHTSSLMDSLGTVTVAETPMSPANISQNTSDYCGSHNVAKVFLADVNSGVYTQTSHYPAVYDFHASAPINVTVPNAEQRLKRFKEKFQNGRKSKQNTVTFIKVPEFRMLLASAFDLLKELSKSVAELDNLICFEGNHWSDKMKDVVNLQGKVCELCNKLFNQKQISYVLLKLQKIKKKRVNLKLRKMDCSYCRKQKEQERVEVHKEIDRWHDILRERDQETKREEEMKKEADYILSEVRKKIQEAKRAVERLKLFKKLRQARRESAVKKGMFILPKHDRSFESKVSGLRDVMVRQLADYEAEEHALIVMLESEQEGQREVEAEWKRRRLKEIQYDNHAQISLCLFGESGTLVPGIQMCLFQQYYNAASISIENLIKIRHEWDVYLVPPDQPDGSSVPQQWIVSELPASDAWSNFLEKKNHCVMQ